MQLIKKFFPVIFPMLRRRITCTLILAGALLSFHPSPLIARVVEQVIAVIDGEPYTLSNFKEYARTKMNREFPVGDLDRIEKEDKEVLEQFITEKLLAAEVKLVGIQISDEDIGRYIGQIKQRNRIGDEELAEALRREGTTIENYRASIRAEIEKGEIINRQVRKKVNITSEDVERYYRLNPKKFTSQERIRLRHILVSLTEGASPEQEKEAIKRALEIREQAMAGGNFAQLAQERSEGAGAAGGGDIGWISRGSLVKEIEEIAFNKLSVGEISQPLRTSLGIHLIKLEGREASRLLPLSDVQEKIKEELYAKALDERFQKWLKSDLRKRHRVDVKLPGVVFRPEETKEGTVDSLMASSSRRSKREPSFLSYLNPLSYIVSETPIEGEDAQGPLSGQNIVSVFGVPLFKTDSDDAPDNLPTLDEINSPTPKSEKSEESGGFFSSIWKKLNPF
ncbi:MAG: peptidylprolyl isomerase [Deltaproteobacteria bacterium]|nr:peptidylprolyl isomerase [Deltaproteobacteria bacterium]